MTCAENRDPFGAEMAVGPSCVLMTVWTLPLLLAVDAKLDQSPPLCARVSLGAWVMLAVALPWIRLLLGLLQRTLAESGVSIGDSGGLPWRDPSFHKPSTLGWFSKEPWVSMRCSSRNKLELTERLISSLFVKVLGQPQSLSGTQTCGKPICPTWTTPKERLLGSYD